MVEHFDDSEMYEWQLNDHRLQIGEISRDGQKWDGRISRQEDASYEEAALWIDVATFEFFVLVRYEEFTFRDNPEQYQKSVFDWGYQLWKLAEYLERHPLSREKIADLLRSRLGQQPREARGHDSDPR
jgi:hypothetical protein